MTCFRTSTLLIAFAAHLGAGCAIVNRPARDGDTANVRGSSAALTPEYLDIRPKTGRIFRVRLDAGTEFVARNQPASRACAAPRTRLAALSVVDQGIWKARRVVVFSGKCLRP